MSKVEEVLNIKVKGTWEVIVRDAKTEEIIEEHTISNVITGSGIATLAYAYYTPFQHKDPDTQVYSRYHAYLLLGSGSGVPASSDLALFTPVPTSAKLATISYPSTSQVQFYVRYLPEDCNGYTYTEAAIYDRVPAATLEVYSDGWMMNHLMLSPSVTKDDTKLVDFYITFQFL